MKIETIVNGGVTLVIIPENDLDEAMLKQLTKQDNEITEIRSRAMVLSRSFDAGLVIGRKAVSLEPEREPESDSPMEEPALDES